MKKNLSYREKLLELSRIYRISDIQNYIKKKKYLTTSQIEHILKKNKVPIPKEINTSYFNRNITTPLNKTGNKINNFYGESLKSISYLFKKSWSNFTNVALGMLNTFPKILSTFSKVGSEIFVNAFSSMHNPKLAEKSTNKFISTFGTILILTSVGLIGFTVFEKFGDNEKIVSKPQSKNEVKKIEPKKEVKKVEPKKEVKKVEPKKEVKKVEPKKEVKKVEPKKKEPSQVTELILPNLNLKTETVLSLFEDVEYDLKKVRFQKRVKPIYFTQFPKDLDEIKDIQLKKETFIKIVLPLVVAENQKILDDKIKLRGISKKRMTSDEEKFWLRQKFKEYKVKNGSVDELIKRMDIIPISIAISQAAKESGWGTSRFALEGNAIFGQWTWNGRGIEPLDREKKQSHKVLRFPILRASVKAYKNNLNTHKSYKEFRDKRYDLRKKNRPIIGLKLIHTLESYAQTGAEYTRTLAKMIEQNSLDDFENVKLTNYDDKKELNL